MCSWGKLWTTQHKERPKSPTATSEELKQKQEVGSNLRDGQTT